MGKKILFLLVCALMSVNMVFAQTQQVVGTVIDSETGEPLVGASVKVEGTTIGAITDLDGKFTLRNLPRSAKQVVVSYMGMNTVKAYIKPHMAITLTADAQDMNEVMVVAFGTAKKSAYTGSAKVVTSESIEKSQASNVINALAGTVTGLQLSSANGAPGSQSTVRVRGFSSINAGKDPLYVVDGAPYDGFDIGNINPNDIESVTVLKDAASNALYGARGANGVIMITTKKAKQGDATITFDAKWGSNSRALQYYNTINNPAQYYEMHYGAMVNNYMSKGMSATEAWIKANQNICGDQSNGGLGYNIWTTPENQMLIGTNGKLNPNATLGRLVNYKGEEYFITPDNWDDAATRRGFRQEYNVNATAAGEKSNFFASMGYLSNEGLTEASDYKRFTGRLKADYMLKPWVKVGMNTSFARYDANSLGNNGSASSNGNIWAMTMGMAPIYPFYIRNADGSYKYDSNGIQMLDYGDGKNGGMYRPFISDANPVQDSRLNTRNNEGNQFSGNAFADFYIYKGLTLTVNGTLNTDEYRTTYVYNPYYGQFDTTGGTVTKGHSRLFSWNLQQLLNYTFTVKDHNNFNFLLGHEYTNDRTYSLSASKSKMFSQDNKELNGAVQDGQAASSSKSEYNNEGYFVRGMYDYDERIFASASFRRDASSHFAPENRWGNFWSAGAAWRIGKESWFPETTWLNEFKLKASVGSQGNDAIGSYMYTDLYTINNSDGNVSTSFGSKGNRDITWETNTNFNTGIEFEVFKRLSGSVEYYYRKTSDMLMRFNVPSSLGYSAFYKNVGDLYNAGVEVELNANIFKKKNFEWDANVNFSYLRNRITKLHDDVKTNSYTDASGKEYFGYTANPFFICEDASMYTFNMREYAGVDPETGESLWWKNVEKSEPIVDAQGQPVLDENQNPTYKTWTEREKTNNYSEADYYLTNKSTVPPFFGGFGTSLKFYGFDFSIQCSYQIGGYGYDYTYASMMSSPTSNNTGSAFHADLLNSWSPENKDSNLPRFQFDDTYTAGQSTRFLTKASYLNIENINFGYSLPRTLLSKAQITGLRLYLQAQNVFYWSKRRGFDPRTGYDYSAASSTAGDATNYSPMRTISAGVKLTI